MKRISVLVGMIAVAAICGGCAFGDRYVDLDYTPKTTMKVEQPMEVSVSMLTCGRKDGDQKRMGQVRNGYGMVTAKVMCKTDDPMKWTSDALAMELEAAGLVVERVSTPQEATNPIVISGELDQYYVDVYMTYSASIGATIVVTCNGQELHRQRYAYTESEAAWWLSAAEYEEAIELAMQRMFKKAMPDILLTIEESKEMK